MEAVHLKSDGMFDPISQSSALQWLRGIFIQSRKSLKVEEAWNIWGEEIQKIVDCHITPQEKAFDYGEIEPLYVKKFLYETLKTCALNPEEWKKRSSTLKPLWNKLSQKDQLEVLHLDAKKDMIGLEQRAFLNDLGANLPHLLKFAHNEPWSTSNIAYTWLRTLSENHDFLKDWFPEAQEILASRLGGMVPLVKKAPLIEKTLDNFADFFLDFQNKDLLQKDPDPETEKLYEYFFASEKYQKKAHDWAESFLTEIFGASEEDIQKAWGKSATLSLQAHGKELKKYYEEEDYSQEFKDFLIPIIEKYYHEKEEDNI